MEQNHQENSTLWELADGADLADIRLDANYPAQARTQRVQRPRIYMTTDLKDTWFHVRGGDDGVAAIAFVEDADRQSYPVSFDMRGALKENLGWAFIRMIVTTQGQFGLWWLPARRAGVRQSSWNDSAIEIATEHAGQCVRVHSVTGPSVFEAEVAAADSVPPAVWPDQPLLRLVELAFGNRLILTPDHPVARHLLQGGGK